MDLGYWKLGGIKLGESCRNVKWALNRSQVDNFLSLYKLNTERFVDNC